MGRLVATARTQARFFCACAFSASLLVEPLACSRSDAMQSYGKKAQAPAKNPAAVIIPSLVKDGEQEAISAIRSKSAEMAAPAVFRYLRGNAPLEKQKAILDEFTKKFGNEQAQEQVFKFLSKENCTKEEKFRVVDLFLLKHGLNALMVFYYRAQLDLGTDFTTSKKEMAKEHPETLSYLQSVAYAISRFGSRGFLAADGLLETMNKFKIFRLPFVSKENIPLTGLTAMIAIERMAQDGTINHGNAISHLSEKYLLLEKAPAAGLKLNIPENSELQSLMPRDEGKFDEGTTGTVISVIGLIDKHNPGRGKGALEALLENPKLDPSARELIKKRLER